MKTKQVINNAKWIIVCKIAQSLLQMLIGMLCARYLGPSNYGLINYAASIVAFVTPIMKLGFDSTLVREFINTPEKEGEVMGTSLVLNVLSGIACIIGVFSFVSVANHGEPTVILVCVLYSTSLIFLALEMVQYWFQYKLLSKYTSLIMLMSYVVVSAYKIFLLITSKSVYWFALTNSLDYAIIGIALIFVYNKKANGKLSFSYDRAKQMLSRGKHYIIASLMIVVIQSTDHIMLTNMISEEENGYYSAAITCATMLQFVYIAIIDSFRPLILSNKKDDEETYKKNVSRLYCVVLYPAVIQCIAFTVFAGLIVKILYGEEYSSTIPVLQILVWYFIFSLMGVVRNVWILAEEKQKYLWRINLTGALFNIVVNFILIPVWGACGAAFASLMTQFFTNFILGYIFKPLRDNNRLLICGINPAFVIKEYKQIIAQLKNRKA
ncbi:MAG: flippase [Ruminococcus sp.]|nr:flippase [Ruminococcus sp.]